MTSISPTYISVHTTDADGTVHDWPSVLTPGTPITVRSASTSWNGEVASVNTSEGGFPQALIDTFVSSGITVIHPVGALPTGLADNAQVRFGINSDGYVLTSEDGQTLWAPVPQTDLTTVNTRIQAVETAVAENTAEDESWRTSATAAFNAVADQADRNANLIGNVLGDPSGDPPPAWTAVDYPADSVVLHLGGV
jgi:hypothetical protein